MIMCKPGQRFSLVNYLDNVYSKSNLLESQKCSDGININLLFKDEETLRCNTKFTTISTSVS